MVDFWLGEKDSDEVVEGLLLEEDSEVFDDECDDFPELSLVVLVTAARMVVVVM